MKSRRVTPTRRFRAGCHVILYPPRALIHYLTKHMEIV